MTCVVIQNGEVWTDDLVNGTRNMGTGKWWRVNNKLTVKGQPIKYIAAAGTICNNLRQLIEDAIEKGGALDGRWFYEGLSAIAKEYHEHDLTDRIGTSIAFVGENNTYIMETLGFRLAYEGAKEPYQAFFNMRSDKTVILGCNYLFSKERFMGFKKGVEIFKARSYESFYVPSATLSPEEYILAANYECPDIVGNKVYSTLKGDKGVN